MLSRAVKQGYATVAKHLNHFGSFLTKYARSLIPKESNSAHTHGKSFPDDSNVQPRL